MLNEFIEVLFWVFFSIVKFVIAPSSMVVAGYTVWPILIICSIGGLIGFYLFFYSGGKIFDWVDARRARKNKKKKIFTKRNKIIVKSINRYGLVGLCLASGVISIPLTGLLAARYFRNRPDAIIFLSASIVLWVTFLTFFSLGFKSIVT